MRRIGAQALLLALFAPGVSLAQSSNVPPIYAIDQTCVGTVQKLGCTANDVSVALVNTSGSPISCTAGVNPVATLDLTAQWQSTATNRFNLGVWIATDGKDPAVAAGSGGSSHCDIFGTPITPTPWNVTGTNVCGNLFAATAGPSTTYVLPHTVDVPCVPNAAGQLILLNVATWLQSAGTCTTATDLMAGTSSKCKSGNFTAQVFGSLIIKKVAVGGGATTFPFSSNGTPTSFTLTTGTQQVIQTNAALTATPQAVTATEGATPGWNLNSITCVDINGASAAGFVTINQATGLVTANLTGTNPSATCTYTNINTAVVNVSKTVTGATAGYVAASTFPITVNCGAGHTQTFNLINGGNAQLAGIPPGTSCTVSEGALPAPAPNYAYGTPGISNAGPFITVAGGSTSSIVTNPITRLSSTITVTKIITGAPATGAPGTYNFSANCGTDGTFAGTVVLAGSATTNTGPIAGIPAGAVCSVSETGKATPPTNYVFGATPPAVPVTTTAAGPNNASFTNPLTRLSSTITINKSITGGPAGGTAATFGYTTTCDAGGPFTTSVTTVASSGSNTITTVPAGATCTVTETTVPAAPTNYAYGTTPAPVMLTTTVAGPNNANFINVLTRQTGSLTVAKDVAGPGSSASQVNGAFPFSVNCGADGTFTGSVTITAGATNSTSVPSVPAGASCTVTETGMPAAPAGFSWNAASYTGNPAAIPPNAAATVTIHNTLSALAAGSISVTKAIVGGPVPVGTFSITVACPANGAIAAYSSTQTVTGGNTVVFTLVPTPNPSCTVTESATLPTAPTNYAWDLTKTPPAPQTVAVGGSVTVTNTLVRQTSTVTVTKIVTGAPATGAPGTYNFSANCGTDGTFTGIVTLTGTATTNTGTIPTSGTLIPAGAVCTVSEGAIPAAPANYAWGTTPPAVTLTTTNAGPNTASFTNALTRLTSTITLNKTVTGGPAGGVTGTFNFSANCTASGDGTFTGAITLTAATSGSSTITPVPAGAICTVSETTVPTAPANYSWGAMPANVSLTTTVAGPNTASFTNTLSRQTSVITVNKTVTGGPTGGVSGAFNFSANCGTDGTFSGTIILTSAGFGSGTIGVPSGATCTVSETSVPGAPTNYAWGATPPVVILTTTTAGPNTANFTNPLNTTFVPINIPVPTLQSWLLMLLGAMLLLMGVYVQQRKSKD